MFRRTAVIDSYWDLLYRPLCRQWQASPLLQVYFLCIQQVQLYLEEYLLHFSGSQFEVMNSSMYFEICKISSSATIPPLPRAAHIAARSIERDVQITLLGRFAGRCGIVSESEKSPTLLIRLFLFGRVLHSHASEPRARAYHAYQLDVKSGNYELS